MTEMQAAVGIAQLKKLNFILKKKKQNRKYLFDILKKKSLLKSMKLKLEIIKGFMSRLNDLVKRKRRDR